MSPTPTPLPVPPKPPEPLPYEGGGTRPGLFPGDLVSTNGILAIVVAARVVIDGTIFNWNAKLPDKYQQANIPSYQLAPLDGVPMTTWLNAHQLVLVDRGHAWKRCEKIRKEYP